MKLTPYTDTRLPTHDIDLEAPPETRWKHVAQKEAKNIGRARMFKETDVYIRLVDCKWITSWQDSRGLWAAAEK